MKIFIAGATGVIGLPLVRSLVTLGHEVVGMTRGGHGLSALKEVGASATAVDALDAAAVREAVGHARPDVVIDQLTWLPRTPAEVFASLPQDTRLHEVGGANLLAAAQAAGAKRYIMQSRGFFLEGAGGQLADESARMRSDAPGVVGDSTRVFDAYEANVLDAALEGVVLRYGFFYGPGTWYRPDGAVADQLRAGTAGILGEGNAPWSFVHIDDAVAATVAALDGPAGVYNIVDDSPLPAGEHLRALARWVGADEPKQILDPAELQAIGPEALYYHTRLSGASNLRAKSLLGFRPRRLLWLQPGT
ncbi:dTDP-4-dehydrorhamnose reductase [Bordetella sp. H567]|uniref:NAD-dependent epimerase/dehydratase family protein n=1 Tax=Bordetella sp. H567 TaxID=1697043 RepID=UPI00081C3CED|nr:NAD-dependent epimerase/dehydratase family protein [Bordetella sp. H567]AOB30387.1 dTDP-4-dehydrorhamnose reductase [Bordetella sp. H567]